MQYLAMGIPKMICNSSLILDLEMLPLLQADRPSAGGDAAQQGARRHQGIASEENLTASSYVSGEQFIQWQQRIAATRREKEEKVRQDTMAVESSAQRVRQLKTENEQLVGRENQLSEESKMEEVLLVDTNAQLGVLHEQLQEAGDLGRFVRQLQEEEEKTKLERTSRVRDIEERLRRMQVITVIMFASPINKYHVHGGILLP